MKVPYSVLQKYIPQLKHTAEEVGDILSQYSYEVEQVYNPGDAIQNVVVGEIRTLDPHPDADRLQLVNVHIGASQFVSIVCGASNIKIGDKVPTALEGATLPGGFEIKPTTIRGQESHGMLCSRKELGLQGDASGIYILPPNTKVGTSVVDVLHLNETIIEIDNKGLGTRASDSMSFYGIARELSAVLELPLKPLEKESLPKEGKAYTIKRDKDVCEYYSLLHVNGLSSYEFDSNVYSQDNYRIDLYVQVDSYTGDETVKYTLDALGYNTKNPAINLGNYIMEETGQPVHVFDAEKIVGKTIHIRKAKKDETLVALDDTVLTLEPGDIVICDSEKIIALAGIIGSKDSAVDDGTKQIVIESAIFDPAQIRKTARRLKMLTGAAKRFERRIPKELAKEALERVAWYLKEAKLAVGEYYESGSCKGEEIWTDLTFDYVRRYIGVAIPDAEIISLLKRVGAEVKSGGFGGGDKHKIKAPYWRLDLNHAEEYIEEVTRLYGYDKIPATLEIDFKVPQHDPLFQLKRSLSEILVGQGYSEVMTYPYSEVKATHQMVNPLDKNLPYLRESLAPALFTVQRNNHVRFDMVAIFEIGNVFGAEEATHLAMTYADKQTTPDNALTRIYHDFVKVLLVLGLDLTQLDLSLDTQGADILYAGNSLGRLSRDYQTLEVSLPAMLEHGVLAPEKYTPIAKYPVVKRDLTLSFPVGTPVKDVKDALQAAAPAECQSIRFVDQFEKDGQVNYSFHIQFRHDDKSLSDDEVNQAMQALEQVSLG